MSKTRRTFVVAFSCLLLLGGISQVSAEVTAKLDRFGDYLLTEISPSGQGPNAGVWSKLNKHQSNRYVVLNPGGDPNGDLWPAVEENIVAPYHPWVVWSRPDGSDYRLAWSRWQDHKWEQIEWVGFEPGLGDELEPNLKFDLQGRPFVAWWTNNEDGHGQVFLSIFLETRWSVPVAASPPETSAWSPELQAVDLSGIVLTYTTPEGTVMDIMTFDLPVTITDDINPQAFLVFHGVGVAVP